ncbi:MAG: MarR family transcriptional regulator [Acidobacteria bacterium]|nr:MarR family transcriptional regulator [Acidobacteriota bacterium]
MAEPLKDYFENCLYFTANSLARTISRMAEEEFSRLGMSTSHAFMLMLVIEKPGISQKDLAMHLNLAQSTISRFVDSLVLKGFLQKKAEGKQVLVNPTKKGSEQLELIQKAWKQLYKRYSEVLGQEAGDEITRKTNEAAKKLGGE